MIRVTIFGKPGCCLCDEALEVLERVRAERDFDLREVDITMDPALAARYGERVPVVAVGEREVFEFHVDAAALRSELERAEGHGRPDQAPGAR